ncbi:MAG: substrate-binding domain-containing protein [Lachnospiraceae bacterium]|nr:substrate-binding domain-containing protein [Lachnospiraceae bacterium]
MKKKHKAKMATAFVLGKREIMKTGMCVLFFLAALLLLTGCGTERVQEKETVDGLDALGSVQVISREEGSGTRSAFAELLGFDESGEDGEPDATTKDAQIVSDAEAVITAVREDESAIGYISMGLLSELEEEKVLAVNGVAGTTENVKSGDYSLSRPFILAWSGNLSELEQDFLTYVKGKGQGIVEESYVAVAKESTFLSGKQTGTITIHGSTSAAPLLEALAEEYMECNPNATVEVVASDSTTGLNDAMQGLCDFGMASRKLKDYEEELLTYETIAQDGIAVIVNGQNPLENVTQGQLKELFTGDITEWEALNAE